MIFSNTFNPVRAFQQVPAAIWAYPVPKFLVQKWVAHPATQTGLATRQHVYADIRNKPPKFHSSPR